MIGARTFTNKTRSEDIACILGARLGFSVDCIAQRNGLTPAQVRYRMKLFGIKLSDYRNGRTPLAERILAAATADSARLLGEIRKFLPPTPPKQLTQ